MHHGRHKRERRTLFLCSHLFNLVPCGLRATRLLRWYKNIKSYRQPLATAKANTATNNTDQTIVRGSD